MRGLVLFLHLRHQAVRLLADGGDDGVDLARRLAVLALDQRIDKLRAVGARAIVLLQGRQVGDAQRIMRLHGLFDRLGVEPQAGHQGVQLFQLLARLRAADDKGLAVAPEGSRVAAAQQDVFPFLHLDLEFHLRAARRVDGFRQGDGPLHGVCAARAGRVERAPAAQADDDQGEKEKGAQQGEAGGYFKIDELHGIPLCDSEKLSNSHRTQK